MRPAVALYGQTIQDGYTLALCTLPAGPEPTHVSDLLTQSESLISKYLHICPPALVGDFSNP